MNYTKRRALHYAEQEAKLKAEEKKVEVTNNDNGTKVSKPKTKAK